jgi:predicted porin
LLRSAGRSADREIKLLGELLMKKHLIAAAVAAAVAAPAFAQNVTVYGRMDLGYQDLDRKVVNGTSASAGSISTKGIEQGGLGGSNIGFRGTEDLGSGLRALFQLEYGITPQNNGAVGAARDSFVGLAGGFGTLRVGRLSLGYKTVNDRYTANGGGWGVGYNGFEIVDVAGERVGENLGLASNNRALPNFTFARTNNAIDYQTPSVSGFTGRLSYAVGSSQTTGDAAKIETAGANQTQVGFGYSAGALALDYANMKDKDSTAAGVSNKYSGNNFGVSYNFGVAQVLFMYSDLERKNAQTVGGAETKTDVDYYTIGARIPLGAARLQISYTDGEIKQGANKWDTSGYQLGAIYAFSKRTEAYALYGDNEVKGTVGGVARKAEQDGFRIGLRHMF